MDYLWTVLFTVLAAAAAGFIGARLVKAEVTPERSRQLVRLLTAAAFLSYFGLGCYKLAAMQFGNWDFGIYDSMLHNAAAGKGFMLDYRGRYDHFSPVMMLFTPLYFIWDNPVWLVFLQSLAMAAAIPIFHAITRHYFRSGAATLLLTAMYVFNPYYSRLTLYDFHSECLFPLLLFSAFYFYSRNRMAWCLVFLAASPLIKEDFVVPVAAAGLWMLTQKGRRKWGVAAIAAGVFWAVFTLKIYFPYLLASDYWHYGRYPLFGSTPAETFRNLLAMAGRFASESSFRVAISVLLPFAFLPLFNWKSAVLFWLPVLAIQLVSTNDHQQRLISHYGSAVLAVTPLAALWGARTLRARLRRKPAGNRRRYVLAFAATLLLFCHVIYCDLPLTRFNSYLHRYGEWLNAGILSLPLQPFYWEEMFRRLEHAEEFRAIVSKLNITPDTVMVCQNEVGRMFNRKARVYDFPELGLGKIRPEHADIFLLDRTNYIGNADIAEVSHLLNSLAANPDYQTFDLPNGTLIFVRNKPLDQPLHFLHYVQESKSSASF